MSVGRSTSAQRAAALARLVGCGPRGCLGSLLALALGMLALFGAEWGLRIIFDPWSVPLGGRPTLTGEWTGRLRTASALRFGLGLRIGYHGASGGGGGARNLNIDGSGLICNRRGERYDYELYGGTEDWGGADSRLTLRSVDTSVTGSGWDFDVRWQGDRLTLSGVNDSFELDERPIGGRTHLIVLDPFVGELRRAPPGELDAVCGELASDAG